MSFFAKHQHFNPFSVILALAAALGTIAIGAPPAAPQSTAPDAKSIDGEWRFVYARHAMYPFLPAYDTLKFGADGAYACSSALDDKTTSGTFTLEAGLLKFSGAPPEGLPKDCAPRLEDSGRTLVLPVAARGQAMGEGVFMRSDKLEKIDFAGLWVSPIPGMRIWRQTEVGKDGACVMTLIGPDAGRSTTVRGFYRRWKAPFGEAVTLLSNDTNLGAVWVVSKYEQKGDARILTTVASAMNGLLVPQDDTAATWTPKDKTPIPAPDDKATTATATPAPAAGEWTVGPVAPSMAR